jgi:hypothetical protein
MSVEKENFEALKKLLAFKKHEQPPPGYFDSLAGDIRSRLRSGEHRQQDLWTELGEEASWLHRLWAFFSHKPAFAGAFGMLVCGLVVTGVIYSQRVDSTVAMGDEPVSKNLLAEHASAVLQNPLVNSSSTNPVMNTELPGSLFDQIGVVGRPAAVNFAPHTGN